MEQRAAEGSARAIGEPARGQQADAGSEHAARAGGDTRVAAAI
jgi:hypothetical protein